MRDVSSTVAVVILVAYASVSALIATLICQTQTRSRPPLVIAWVLAFVGWPTLAFGYGVALLCTRKVDDIWPT